MSESRTAWSTAISSSTEPWVKLKRGSSRTASRLESLPVERLSRTKTSWPAPSNASAKWEPMKPAPPVMRYRGTRPRLADERPTVKPCLLLEHPAAAQRDDAGGLDWALPVHVEAHDIAPHVVGVRHREVGDRNGEVVSAREQGTVREHEVYVAHAVEFLWHHVGLPGRGVAHHYALEGLHSHRKHGPRHGLACRVPDPYRERLAGREPFHELAGAADQLDPLDLGLARAPAVAPVGPARGAVHHDRGGVGLHHLARAPVSHLLAVLEPDGVVAHVYHRAQRVRDDDDGLAVVLQVLEALQALALEGLVANRQHLVNEQDVGLHVDRYREAEAHVHARGVVLHGLVDELAYAGEVHDIVESLLELLLLQAEDRPVQKDVLATGQLGVEACAELEQGGHLASHGHRPFVRAEDAGYALQHGGLARAVLADEARGRPLGNLEGDVAE